MLQKKVLFLETQVVSVDSGFAASGSHFGVLNAVDSGFSAARFRFCC